MRRCWLLLLALPAVADDNTAPPSQLADLLGSDADAGFERALEPREFVFPRDLGPHESFRNEWWYVTGNLDGENGERFGFELTFFRFSLSPSPESSQSAWRTNQVYIAHFAVTDANNEKFYVAQRYSRGGALGLAGASASPFEVWVEDWRLDQAGGFRGIGTWNLQAADNEIAIDLEVSPQKPPVFNGDDGLSQKSAQPGNASYYYSVTRLRTTGTVRIGDDEYEVRGLSWLDREWSTSALADDQVGWDWFALQLDDGTELMFYSLRNTDGSQGPASAGTSVDAVGNATHLASSDVAITVLDTWQSPKDGTYPSRWQLSLPDKDLELTVTPVMANQELFTTVRYWEGAVDVAGQRNGQPVTGRGYVELTGYAD